MEDKDNNYEEDYNKYIEEEEEERRHGMPFFLLFLFTTVGVLFALGLSFSTINFLDKNETINSLISTITGDDDKEKYVITYTENTGPYSSGIYLVNQFPITDAEGKSFEGEGKVFVFSLIIGDKTAGAYYEFTAVPNSGNTLPSGDVKIYLEKNGKGVDYSYKDNGKVKVYTDYQKSKYDEAEGVVIYSDTISEEEAEKGRIDFVMRMWVSEDVNSADASFSNKTFGVKVNTYAAFVDR